MKQIDLSMVDDNFLQDYLTSIDIDKIKINLKNPKYQIIIDKLNLLIKADWSTIKKYLNISNYYTIEELKEIEKAFDYTAHRKKSIFIEHFKKLNLNFRT